MGGVTQKESDKNELFGGVSSGREREKWRREKASERWSEGERNREIDRQRAFVCV